MSNQAVSAIITVVLGVIMAAFFIGAGLGRSVAEEKWQREAVRAGHAEYMVGESGESVWQWKDTHDQ